MSKRHYTLHHVRCEDLDLSFVVATGRPTDPVYVSAQNTAQDALERLASTPFFGRQGMKAIQWSLEAVARNDPRSFVGDDGRPTAPLWETAKDLWEGAQRWAPYTCAIKDHTFHLYYNPVDEDGGRVELGMCSPTDTMVRSLLGEFADMSGRAPFDVAQLANLYYRVRGQLLPEGGD